MTTNFQKVEEFHNVFELHVHKDLYVDVFDKDPKLVELRHSLIKEEITELHDAVENKDIFEVIDALGDILYVVYGTGASFGISLDKTMSYLYKTLVKDIKDSDFDMTNYNKIKKYFTLCKTPMQTSVSRNTFDIVDPDIITHRLELIDDDLKILEETLQSKNMIAVIQVLTDMLYSTYAMGLVLGCPMDTVFELIHKSNMSKTCTSEKEAVDTVKWYMNQLKNSQLLYDSPTYKQSKIKKHWIVYNESTGKILKSINYKPVSFDLIF